MSKYLLDTNIVIDYAKNIPEAVDLIESFTEPPIISVITVAEIMQGIRERERAFFSEVFELWTVLPITHDIALLAGEYGLKYRKSHSIGLADAFIAATAEYNDLNLFTRNLKDFPMFEMLKKPY